jgi:MoxR-like ATPase
VVQSPVFEPESRMTDSGVTPEPGRAAPVDDVAAAQRVKDAHARIKKELRKAIVGLDGVIDELLISVFARGHCLLVGVPGLAKTLLISTLARSLSLSFNRIQFTPDLMPADITGTEVIQEDRATGTRQLKFLRGPIFANVILADEINRTPPKTQAALLEAMQERQVTVGGVKHPLAPPFFVLATQNPIEQEGTYPLPEAQLDRFMFNVRVDYPTEREELEIVEMTTKPQHLELTQVLTGPEILELNEVVRRVPVPEHVLQYVLRIVRATRVGTPDAAPFAKERVAWGAGPRASQYLVLAAKARALLQGRLYVAAEDVRAVAHPVLRHRIITTYGAEAEGYTSDRLIDELLATIPATGPAAAMPAGTRA